MAEIEYLGGKEAHVQDDVTSKDPTLPAVADLENMPDKPFRVTFTVVLNPDEPEKTDEFVLEIHPGWAPLAAERFNAMRRLQFFDDSRFFNVGLSKHVQFGIAAVASGGPAAKFHHQNIRDIHGTNNDPVPDPPNSNTRGTVSFALGHGKRTTQMFINTVDSPELDKKNFMPFGKVLSGMEVLDAVYYEYGQSPKQKEIYLYGNSYLNKQFPRMSFIKSVRCLDGSDCPVDPPPPPPPEVRKAKSKYGLRKEAAAKKRREEAAAA